MKQKSSIDKRLDKLVEKINKEKEKEQEVKVPIVTIKKAELKWKLRKKQDNICPICENMIPEDAKIGYDVGTGKPKGLLCTQCYMGLMNFKQNKKFIERAWSFLDMQPPLDDPIEPNCNNS